MSNLQPRLLCQYGYDPLDRLINHAQRDTPGLQHFYCKSRLVTALQGTVQHSIFQHDDQLLAQQRCESDVSVNALLATDQQRSVSSTLDGHPSPQSIAYSPYGHRRSESGLNSLLGFNGEQPDPVTGHYHLGNGYRQYNPVLMRFNSPDSWSPFGAGGLNAYAYCEGDPVNRSDQTGHAPRLLITKKIDGILQRLVTGRVRKNKTITPLSTVDDAVVCTSAAPKATMEKKYVSELARRREVTVQARTLTKNESALEQQSLYSVNNDLRELSLNDSATLYERAKIGYEFKKYPDVNWPYYMPDTNGRLNVPGQGASVLDMTHWNVTINYYRNMRLVGASYAHREHGLIIKRAEYIRKHTGIDLRYVRR